MDALVQWFTASLSGLVSKEAIIFIISMIPILELRGGLLAASPALLNVPMEQILIPVSMPIQKYEQQDVSCCSFLCNYFRHDRTTVRFSHFPSYTADEYITISTHFGSVQYQTLIFQATA